MTDVSGAQISFPMVRRCPLDPPEEFQRARESGVIEQVTIWNGTKAWLVTRYDDVVQVLTDSRFSADPSRPNYPSPTESRATLLLNEPPALGQMHPPEHTKIRRIFGPMFAVRRLELLRPQVITLVDDLIVGLKAVGPPADLYGDFARPVTTQVIAYLLGIPQEDNRLFSECALARAFHTRGDALAAGEKLGNYFDTLLSRREKELGDGQDVISLLVKNQIRPGHLTHDQAIVLLRNLLVNGQNTTASNIALGTLALLRAPAQFAAIQADPERIPAAIEEILRYATTAHFQSPRTATEDVELRGQIIRKGEGVIASLPSANRDPRIFPNPDAFDITRDARRHLAFASGIHSCLGQPLARLELEVVFRALASQLPSLELAEPFESITFTGNESQTYGVHRLPVKW